MRQPQRVWKTFYRLKLRANFFLGKSVFEKTTFCTARPLGGSGITLSKGIKFVAPWKAVRSDEFVNKRITPITAAQLAALNEAGAHRNEKNKRIMATYHEGQKPYTEAELLAVGRTHFVGDDCPGGHGDCCGDHVAVGYQAGTLPAQPDNTAVGTQHTAIGPDAKNFVAACAEKIEQSAQPFIDKPKS